MDNHTFYECAKLLLTNLNDETNDKICFICNKNNECNNYNYIDLNININNKYFNKINRIDKQTNIQICHNCIFHLK